MKGLFVKNCKPTRSGWYVVRINGKEKHMWGLYVAYDGTDKDYWILYIPCYFTCISVKITNTKKIEWMPSTYADPDDCPLTSYSIDSRGVT